MICSTSRKTQNVYSDNVRILKAAWISYHHIRKVSRLSKRNSLVGRGGLFDCMARLMKQCLYKSVGKSILKWNKLEDILLDIENTLNNRPLLYLEDNIQFSVVTHNSPMYGEEIFLSLQWHWLCKWCLKKVRRMYQKL